MADTAAAIEALDRELDGLSISELVDKYKTPYPAPVSIVAGSPWIFVWGHTTCVQKCLSTVAGVGENTVLNTACRVVELGIWR